MVAVAVAYASGGDFEQTCRRGHTTDPELAARWGCYQPTDEPTFWLGPCPFCQGHDESCKHCGGENRIAFYRCPHELGTADLVDVVQSVALVEQGILPEQGAWHDQPTTWVQSFGLVSNEIGRTREALQQKAMQQANAKSRARGR